LNLKTEEPVAKKAVKSESRDNPENSCTAKAKITKAFKEAKRSYEAEITLRKD